MALAACPECGHQVSSDAKACPSCGRKLKSDFLDPGANLRSCLGCLLLLVVLGVGGVVLLMVLR